MSGKKTSIEAEEILKEESIRKHEEFLEREGLLTKKGKGAKSESFCFKIELLKWLGQTFQRFLEVKEFSDVRVGYVRGHQESEGIDPKKSEYAAFSELDTLLAVSQSRECTCLWLKIEFGSEGNFICSFQLKKAVFLRKIEDDEMNLIRISSMINEFTAMIRRDLLREGNMRLEFLEPYWDANEDEDETEDYR